MGVKVSLAVIGLCEYSIQWTPWERAYIYAVIASAARESIITLR